MLGKPILCIDFDGTIVDHAFPQIGDLKPGVKHALDALHPNFEIVIWSGRSSKRFGGAHNRFVKEMVEFLDLNQIPYDWWDDGSHGKVVARWYIDDRAVTFNDNWRELVGHMESKLRVFNGQG